MLESPCNTLPVRPLYPVVVVVVVVVGGGGGGESILIFSQHRPDLFLGSRNLILTTELSASPVIQAKSC